MGRSSEMGCEKFRPITDRDPFNFNIFRSISKRTQISSHQFGYGMVGYWICDETCMGRILQGTKFVNEINRTKLVK